MNDLDEIGGVGDISALIDRVNQGVPGAQEALFAAAYGELRKLARSRLRDGGRNVCLDTTALVHESYLRYVDGGRLRAQDRRAFFAYASRVMRSVIIDSVRKRRADRRGGHVDVLTLNTQLRDQLPAAEDQLLQVHEALGSLAEVEPLLAQVVEMSYFGGYTEQEIADTLEVAERSVRRYLKKARLLLAAMIES